MCIRDSYYTNAILLKLDELKKEDQKDFIKEIKRRKMIKNLKANNVKQLLKKLLPVSYTHLIRIQNY